MNLLMEEGVTDDLIDEASSPSRLGPIFLATYDGDDACCGEGIQEGESVRADGRGGWIHANGECDEE